MEIDDVYPPAATSRPPQQPHHNTTEEDYDMMVDDDLVAFNNTQPTTRPLKLGGTQDSKWAKATTPRHSYRDTALSTPAYLDDDPTLTAPTRPYRPQHTSIYNYNRN